MNTTVQPNHLYEPYGFMTENEGVRQSLKSKGLNRMRQVAGQLRAYMPKDSYLEVGEDGIKYAKVSKNKKVPFNNSFVRAINGPTIPFKLTESTKNIEKFFLKFETACLKAIAKGRIKTLLRR